MPANQDALPIFRAIYTAWLIKLLAVRRLYLADGCYVAKYIMTGATRL